MYSNWYMFEWCEQQFMPEGHIQGFPKVPNQVLGAYPETEPKIIDSYDVCAILVDKHPSGALLMLY